MNNLTEQEDKEIERLQKEIDDLYQEINRMIADSFESARKAEEAGYARGLADARRNPEVLGLRKVVEYEASDGAKWKPDEIQGY